MNRKIKKKQKKTTIIIKQVSIENLVFSFLWDRGRPGSGLQDVDFRKRKPAFPDNNIRLEGSYKDGFLLLNVELS